MKKEYPLHLIFTVYFFSVIFLSIYYWKKLSIIEEELENKIITNELYQKKRKVLKRQFRFFGFTLVVCTFILMVLYAQWYL